MKYEKKKKIESIKKEKILGKSIDFTVKNFQKFPIPILITFVVEACKKGCPLGYVGFVLFIYIYILGIIIKGRDDRAPSPPPLKYLALFWKLKKSTRQNFCLADQRNALKSNYIPSELSPEGNDKMIDDSFFPFN